MKIMKAKHISNLLLSNCLKTLWLKTIIYYFTAVRVGGAVLLIRAGGWQIWLGLLASAVISKQVGGCTGCHERSAKQPRVILVNYFFFVGVLFITISFSFKTLKQRLFSFILSNAHLLLSVITRKHAVDFGLKTWKNKPHV